MPHWLEEIDYSKTEVIVFTINHPVYGLQYVAQLYKLVNTGESVVFDHNPDRSEIIQAFAAKGRIIASDIEIRVVG